MASRWAGDFELSDKVTIIVSGETGVVVAVWINNQYTVRYCQADGVAVERVWDAGALRSADGSNVTLLRAVS